MFSKYEHLSSVKCLDQFWIFKKGFITSWEESVEPLLIVSIWDNWSYYPIVIESVNACDLIVVFFELQQVSLQKK